MGRPALADETRTTGYALMPDFATLATDLGCSRDGIRLKIPLGSKEAQDEWAELEDAFECVRKAL